MATAMILNGDQIANALKKLNMGVRRDVLRTPKIDPKTNKVVKDNDDRIQYSRVESVEFVNLATGAVAKRVEIEGDFYSTVGDQVLALTKEHKIEIDDISDTQVLQNTVAEMQAKIDALMAAQKK